MGGVAEWSKAAVLKTVVGKPTGGSNPSASALEKHTRKGVVFVVRRRVRALRHAREVFEATEHVRKHSEWPFKNASCFVRNETKQPRFWDEPSASAHQNFRLRKAATRPSAAGQESNIRR